MRHTILLSAFLPQACLLGADTFKGGANVPQLESVVLVAPLEPAEDGRYYGTLGTEVVVDVSTSVAVDAGATLVTLGGFPMVLAERRSDTTLRYRRTFDRSEGNAPLTVSGVLRDTRGKATSFTSDVVVVADFQPPFAVCILSPTPAWIGETVELVVTTSEPLRGGLPDVVPSTDDIQVEWSSTDAGQIRFTVEATPGVDVDGYSILLLGTDLAGNRQAGASLCDAEDRTGSILGAGPDLLAEPVIDVDSAVTLGGTLWARAGAEVTVRLSLAGMIDPVESAITLSGAELFHRGDNVWSRVLTATEGLGLRDLDARIVDLAGNTLRVQRQDVVGFDFEPPALMDTTLSREPFWDRAESEAGSLLVTDHDPITGEPVHVRVSVSADEPLSFVHPLLATGPTDQGWSPGTMMTARRIDYELPDVGLLPTGTYRLSVRLEDAVGNISEPLPVPDAIVVRRIRAPGTPDPDVDTFDRIVLERAPWGQVRTGGAPSFTVSGAAGAVSNDDLVVLRSERGAVLGTARAGGDGAFGPVELGGDPVRVMIASADDAGNLSSERLVRHVWWETSLFGRRRGSSIENPSRLMMRQAWTPSLFSDDIEPDQANIDALAVTGAPLPVEGAMRWQELTPETPERGGGLSGAVYDTARGALVLVRGSEVWERQGIEWRLASPSDAEGALYGATVAYDAVRERVVAYGGSIPSNVGCTTGCIVGPGFELWEWDGTSWSEPNATGPELERGSVLAHDVVHGMLWLVGSPDGRKPFEVWSWDGASWRDHTVAGGPSVRTGYGVVYDPGREELLLVGGEADGSDLDDTWAWTGDHWEERLTGSRTSPGPTRALVYDQSQDRVLRVAGEELWSWDGETWAKLDVPDTSFPSNFLDGVYDEAIARVLFVASSNYASDVEVVSLHETHWDREHHGTSPDPRAKHAAAYHLGTQTLVAFGGAAGDGDETLLWRRGVWDRGVTPVGLEGRSTHGLALDWDSGCVVMFGGVGSGGSYFRSDTWQWCGSAWEEVGSAAGPGSRGGMGLASDSWRSEIVLFGGRDGQAVFDDTWVWASGAWSPRSLGTHPSARAHPAMTFDPIRGVIVLFGGYADRALSVRLDDTWEWDGEEWTPVPTDLQPSPRGLAGLTFDESIGAVRLTGGDDGGTRGDQWGFDGVSWTTLPVDAWPGARKAHVAVRDESTGRLVVFGGANDISSGLGDTLEYDGRRWTILSDEISPGARDSFGLAMDPRTGHAMLFGGEGAYQRDDTWLWNGLAWERLATPVFPSARRDPAMANDPERDVVVLFGGTSTTRLDDTWEWDGHAWTLIPSVEKPSAQLTAMAHDPIGGGMLLFGGDLLGSHDSGETWRRDGTEWTRLDVEPAPPARYGAKLALLPDGEGLLLYGGYSRELGRLGDQRDDTWQWDGEAWHELTATSSSAGARAHFALSYDPDRNATLLHGGNSGAVLMDLWSYSALAWHPQFPIGPLPTYRDHHAMVYLPDEGGTFLAGGGAYSTATLGLRDDLWLLDSGANSRPAVILTTPFDAASAGADASVASVDLRWVVGGAGYPDGQPVYGTEILVWEAGAWQTVTIGPAPASAPGEVCVRMAFVAGVPAAPGCATVDRIGRSARFLFGDDQQIVFAARPIAPGGQGDQVNPHPSRRFAKVVVDTPEVVVHYVVP